MAAARGDIVGLLHDGTLAGRGWLDVAARHLDDETIAAIGPKLVRDGRYLELTIDEAAARREDEDGEGRSELVSAVVAGNDVLGDIVGTAVQPPAGDGPSASRAARAGAPAAGVASVQRGEPFYAPLPEGGGGVDVLVNGEPVRPRRVLDLLQSAGLYLAPDGSVGDIAVDCPDGERFDAPEERFGLRTTALVFARDTWRRVGPFEPRFGSSYEDCDWCWRARLLGLRLIFDPGAQVRVRQAATDGRLPGDARGPASDPEELGRIMALVRNAPLRVATAQVWGRRAVSRGEFRRVTARAVPLSYVARARSRRRWVLRPEDVFERWAGVDAPSRVARQKR